MKSKYLEVFKTLTEEFGDALELTEDVIRVEEILPEEIKRESGLIVGAAMKMFGEAVDGVESSRPTYCRVLQCGPGTTEKPMKLKPGDVITVGPNSVIWYRTIFNNIVCASPRIGKSRASESLETMKGVDTYSKIGQRLYELTEKKKDDGS